jgi:acyl-CoA synthetase (AMP-forming)/AMP-acid ligase II
MHDLLVLLRRRAAEAPHAPAISELTVDGWTTTTNAELCRDIEAVAGQAATLSGPVIVVLDGSVASVAVVIGLLAGSACVLCLEQGSSHLADPHSVVWTLDGAVVAPDTEPAVPPADRPRLAYRQLLTPSEDRRDVPVAEDGRDPEVMLLASGSPGEPRLVRHRASTLSRGARLYGGVHGYRSSDKVLLPVPIAHSFGLVGGLLAGLVSGAEMLTMPTFSLSGLRSGLAGGATVLLGTPLVYTMASRSLLADLRASDLRVLLSSGGPLAVEVGARIAQGTGKAVRQVYGSTETGLIACRDGSDRDWQPGSVGVFAPGVEWRLGDPGSGPGGRSGRPLTVRTTTMFLGHVGGRDEPTLRDDGFYETGDLVDVSASGEVFVVGRKDTFVNVGGRKVNPRRVERVIRTHPDVADVHVFGMAAHHEEAVHAVVVPVPGREGLRTRDITDFCRTELAPHETPHRVHVLPSLPRTAQGNVDPAVVAAITD